MNPVIIITSRFTLRPYRKRDLPSIVKHVNDKQIFRNMLSIPCPYTLKDAEEEYRKLKNIMRRRGFNRIVLAIEMDSEAAGIINLSIEGHKAEIGYWLGRAYWGNGIMTEVVKEISDYGFKELGLKRIIAHVYSYNKASMRVLEKAGYKFEGILRKNIQRGDRLLDEYLFARVR